MIKFGLPIRCASLSAAGSYDTHEGEEDSFPGDLKVTADSLFAFQRHLEALGIADRVLTLVWSEFGRRPEENGSAGTDHGAAGTALPDRDQGTGADGRRVPPDLATLDEDDNLRPQLRLPQRLQRPARAVVRRRRRLRDPRRRHLHAVRGLSLVKS